MDPFTPLFEAVVDAPADAPASDPAPAEPDGGGEPAAPTPGAADGIADPTPAATPTIDSWLESDEGQQRLNQQFEQWQSQREQAAQAQQEAERRQAEQATEFTDVEEALSLLGLSPDRFRAYIDSANAPLTAVAAKVQAQEAALWVSQSIDALAQTHPDLLSEDLGKLSELVGEDGQPMFDLGQVRESNKIAVTHLADSLQRTYRLDNAKAIQESAKAVEARDKTIARIAVERYKQELRTASTARPDLSGGGTNGTTHLTGVEGGDELALARRWSRENS